jgi:hypothetical protein
LFCPVRSPDVSASFFFQPPRCPNQLLSLPPDPCPEQLAEIISDLFGAVVKTGIVARRAEATGGRKLAILMSSGSALC